MPPISRSARRLTVALGGLALCMSAAGFTSAQDGVPSPQSQQGQQQGQQSTPTLPAGAQQQELEQALVGLDEAANKIDGMEESELAQNRPNIETSLQRLELALIQGSDAGPARFTAARDAIDAARASLRSDDAERKDLAAALRKVTAAVKDARAQARAPGTPGAQQVATPPADPPPEAQLRPLDVDRPQTTGALMQREGAGEVVARPPAEDRPVAAMGRKLIGMQVVGADKAYIGSVGDVVMDGDRARAVILRIGGFLGLGARRIAIPVERLRLDDNRLASTLNEQEARSLPAYEP